jgi:hypothetical protein
MTNKDRTEAFLHFYEYCSILVYTSIEDFEYCNTSIEILQYYGHPKPILYIFHRFLFSTQQSERKAFTLHKLYCYVYQAGFKIWMNAIWRYLEDKNDMQLWPKKFEYTHKHNLNPKHHFWSIRRMPDMV